MEIRQHAFALALAETAAVLYAICAFIVALWPELALQFMGSMMHLVNVEQFATDIEITWGSFLIGLIQAVVYSYVAGWLFTWFYNRTK